MRAIHARETLKTARTGAPDVSGCASIIARARGMRVCVCERERTCGDALARVGPSSSSHGRYGR